MTPNILINNAEKYDGQYVATRNFLDKNVAVSGSNLIDVYKAAKEKGIESPVVFYVPPKNEVQIY